MRNDDRMIQSGGKIPFSWENIPGVSKMRNNNNRDLGDREPSSSPTPRSLPPPPCPLEGRWKPKLHEMPIHLPPCTFQTPPPTKYHRSRGGSNPKKDEKNRKVEGEDPFFAAYKECTKVGKNTRKDNVMGSSGSGWFRNHLNMGLSCKTSAMCGVRDDNLAKIPRFS